MTVLYDENGNVISSNGDITEDAGSSSLPNEETGGPNPYDASQGTYDFKYRVFPADLGQSDNDHYMVININVPVNMTQTYTGSPRPSTSLPTGTDAGAYSKVDRLRFGTNQLGGNSVQGANFLSQSTRRIQESIALHMPNGGLVYTESNKYEEVSMTALGKSFISGMLNFIPDNDIRKTATKFLDSVGNVIESGGKVLGTPINPRVEVLFATRPQRQWTFEVFMIPRSKKEADTIKEIIYTLRYYAAPELIYGGFAFIPPAEFDITFYQNGKENMYLPRINTCVLEQIDIDYAPEGAYSTFKNGEPVAVRLSLAFRELEITHKRRVLEGF